MDFDHIERLKSEYTDKYVVVDESRPELRRFRGWTGTVRTVNMSGRALVEFDSGDNNIGWFDIDLDYLKVIAEPLPKEEPVKKAAPKKEAAPAKAEKPKPSGGMSTADILAAARANKGGDAEAKPKPAAMSTADILAAARANKSTAEAKPEKAESAPAADPSKMSTADILAAARANKPTGGAAPAEAPAAEPEPEPEPEPEAAETEEAPAAESAPTEVPTDIDGILAYCRKVDGA